MIIGISGEGGHGKNEVALMIERLYSAQFTIPNAGKIIKVDFHDKFSERAFADPLKRVCSALTNYPLEVFYNREKKEEIIPHLNITLRALMQKVGQAMRGIDENIFVYSAINRVKPNENLLFTDMRHLNEKEAIENLDGITLRIVRFVDGKKHIDPSLDTEEKRNHPSETELRGEKFDFQINNFEGLEELEQEVIRFMKEFKLLKE